jgi:recombination protein RecA
MNTDDIVNKLKKDYPKTLYVGDENDKLIVRRLPSNCFMFDMLTGGGVPKNRYVHIHGPKSCGKTTFSLRMARSLMLERPDLKVAFIDFEGTFDKDWAARFLPSKDNLITVRPDYGEEGVDIARGLIEADDLGLLVIDSLGGITSVKQADAGASEYAPVAIQVKLINHLLRVIFPFVSQAWKEDRDLTIILLNQVRINMNAGKYGSPYSPLGGEYLKHMISMGVRLYPGKFSHSRGVPIKADHEFKIDKNKVGLPERKGEFTMWYADVEGHKAGDIDEDDVVLAYAKRAGIIKREGTNTVIPMRRKPLVFDTQAALLAEFATNRKLFETVKKATLKICIANPLFTADEKEEKKK